MKDLNYEKDIVPKLSDEVIVPELFTKNIKIERTYKELLEDILTPVENSEITKKPEDDLKLVFFYLVIYLFFYHYLFS